MDNTHIRSSFYTVYSQPDISDVSSSQKRSLRLVEMAEIQTSLQSPFFPRLIEDGDRRCDFAVSPPPPPPPHHHHISSPSLNPEMIRVSFSLFLYFSVFCYFTLLSVFTKKNNNNNYYYHYYYYYYYYY